MLALGRSQAGHISTLAASHPREMGHLSRRSGAMERTTLQEFKTFIQSSLLIYRSQSQNALSIQSLPIANSLSTHSAALNLTPPPKTRTIFSRNAVTGRREALYINDAGGVMSCILWDTNQSLGNSPIIH